MKKLLIKIIMRYIRADLEDLTDISKEDRKDAYSSLYSNIKMMKVLAAILKADTIEMMTKDAFSEDRFIRGVRYGMFLRAKAIKDKAKELYELEQRENSETKTN